MMKGQKGYLQVEGQARLGSSFMRLLSRLARWHTLSRERQMLASLSDDALKDIGLSRADIEGEAHQHFWNDPRGKGR